MNVLVVEDDPHLAGFLCRVLTEEGHVCTACDSGVEAIALAREGLFHLIVLDWMLPDADGVAVCVELRRLSCLTPILMLTARGEVADRVVGLQSGADDYLAKPFDVNELVARVFALLRRSTSTAPIRVGELQLSRMARTATLAGARLDLTDREFALLFHLAEHAGEINSRASLLREVWGLSLDPSTNVVEVHVSRLRDKLGGHAWLIETIRGAGYRLRTERA